MASLRRTSSGCFIACFRFGGRQHQRALKTREPDAAEAALGAIVNRIYKITAGDIQPPLETDVIDFIVWGDAAVRTADPPEMQEKEPQPTLEQLTPSTLPTRKA